MLGMVEECIRDISFTAGCSVLTADESAAGYIASAWLSRLLFRLRLPACLLLVDTPALTTSTLTNRWNTYKQLLNTLLITDAMEWILRLILPPSVLLLL